MAKSEPIKLDLQIASVTRIVVIVTDPMINYIWSFAAATDETDRPQFDSCPCINRNRENMTLRPPSFVTVGNDYFCDTGAENLQYYTLVTLCGMVLVVGL